MIEPSKIHRGEQRHEDVFLARYGRLRAWALRLTLGDAGRAEDLVHDAFVQFTFSRPDLERVWNLDGYLYRVLRNLNVSQLRRARGPRGELLAASEYDSAEVMLRAADPREVIREQDKLRQVCRYACLRKDSSKAGSVLIMRFIHGYYPREIGRAMRISREAVEERLRVARNEAKQFVKDPASLRLMSDAEARKRVPTVMGFAQSPEELLRDLRRAVFDSRPGGCFSEEQLAGLYDEGGESGLDCATLAHIVSCRQCLDEVNRINGLPLLSERYPTDTLGTEPREKGGGDDGSGPTGTASKEDERRCRKRADDVFEHRPRELCVSVNNRRLATQKVGAELNRQELNIGPGEEVNSVEVFSEQGVRLLFLDPATWPADVGGGYVMSMALSDRRRLEVALRHDGPLCTVQVTYCDPLAAPSSVAQAGEAEAEHALTETIRVRGTQEPVREGRRLRALAGAGLEGLRSGLGHFLFRLRPVSVAGALSILVVAALLFVRFQTPVVSAAELLRRATEAEESGSSRGPALVLHRTVFAEETGGGRRTVRRRVELWQSSASGISLRRLYDEQNNLLAAEWTNSDGTSNVYRRDTRPEEGVLNTATALLEAREIWRLEPSVKRFSALGIRPEELTAEEQSSFYLLTYQAPQGSEGLVRAQLWLNRADLHAFRLTLVLNRGGERVEYRLIEGEVERRRTEAVPPSVYQLEPELLDATGAAASGVRTARAQGRDEARPAAGTTSPPAAIASAELEVEIAHLLNGIRANLGEQVSMGRTTGGALRVDALVESEERKEAILRALGPVLQNPSVVVEVNTIEEALKKRPPPESGPSGVTEREVSVRTGRIPADAELRAHLAARTADGGQLDEKVNQFAVRAMARSRQALLHASALKRLVGRFTPAEVRALGPEPRAKWLSMIREHAQAYRREAAALRIHLSAVFPASGDAAPSETADEANVGRAAAHLLDLSYAQDAAVRSAFTVSEAGGTAAAIKSAQFWRSLAASERLAASIQDVYHHSGF
jgi:RNA polymerase sigma factor (sigma-70 family)